MTYEGLDPGCTARRHGAFLHAVALVGADGVPAVAFLPYAQRILEVLTGTLPGLPGLAPTPTAGVQRD